MNGQQPPPGSTGLRLFAQATVIVVVLALAAATFVLSYAGVHAIALEAGVSKSLARLYPFIFDAVLVVACAAALMLRDAGWWLRSYAWLSIVIIVGVIGTADAVHAMGVKLPSKPAAGTVAAVPWALVMLGFSLWLTMLRHARGSRAAGTASRVTDAPQAPEATAGPESGLDIITGRGSGTSARPTPAEVPRPLPQRHRSGAIAAIGAQPQPEETTAEQKPQPAQAAADTAEPGAEPIRDSPISFNRVRSTPTPPD
jgi:Protein of unknown function (DUF2637)